MMPSVLTESRRMCPELIEAVKVLDDIAYTRHYSEVFSDLVDYLVFEHLMPPSEANPLAKKYNTKEQTLFKEALKIILGEVKNRVDIALGQWYDPLGKLYETITSKYTSKRMGQYFTPSPVVDMMVQMTNPGRKKEVETILDPACGSGRMGLSSAAYAMSKGTGTYVCLNDLDGICTKMSAVNMCFNGIVGEATAMNGLDVEGKSYRFGYRVEPLLARVPKEMWEYYRMLVLMKTGQDVKQQYVLHPITYEQTFIKGANDRLLKEWEERQKIKDEQKREAALEDLKNQVKARMAGSLFEQDDSILENIELPSEIQKKKNFTTKNKPPKNNENKQGSLF